jgi:hypothetical protein
MEDLGIDRRIILEMNFYEIVCDSLDWIHLPQDKDQWQVPENMAINLWVPQKVCNFLTSYATMSFT